MLNDVGGRLQAKLALLVWRNVSIARIGELGTVRLRLGPGPEPTTLLQQLSHPFEPFAMLPRGNKFGNYQAFLIKRTMSVRITAPITATMMV